MYVHTQCTWEGCNIIFNILRKVCMCLNFSYFFYFQQTSFSSLSLPSLNKTFPVEVTNIYYYVHLAG